MMHPAAGRRSSVNRSLTPKRRIRVTENDQYAAFLRRAIRAYSRRVGSGDIDALADMTRLAAHLDQAITEAVDALRTGPTGYSWADIALRLGITRQAAQQRWGTAPGHDPDDPSLPGGCL
jgi:hypothetical protein